MGTGSIGEVVPVRSRGGKRSIYCVILISENVHLYRHHPSDFATVDLANVATCSDE